MDPTQTSGCYHPQNAVGAAAQSAPHRVRLYTNDRKEIINYYYKIN